MRKTDKSPCTKCGKKPFGPAWTNDRNFPSGLVVFISCESGNKCSNYIECDASGDVIKLWNEQQDKLRTAEWKVR